GRCASSVEPAASHPKTLSRKGRGPVPPDHSHMAGNRAALPRRSTTTRCNEKCERDSMWTTPSDRPERIAPLDIFNGAPMVQPKGAAIGGAYRKRAWRKCARHWLLPLAHKWRNMLFPPRRNGADDGIREGVVFVLDRPGIAPAEAAAVAVAPL